LLTFNPGDKESFWVGWELAGDLNYNFSQGGVASLGNLSQVLVYSGDEETKNATKKEEYPYDSSDLARESKSHPHHDRFVTVFDHDVKLCSPQMLHMGDDNAPLWFNGWILDSKYEPP
jgi:hypothetical protein